MTRHCFKCGTEWIFHRHPGRIETCERCGADLHACLNCVHYDKTVAYHCRERRAEEVADKDRANYCEFFEMAKRVWSGVGANAREDAAREKLKKLLGD
jgi:hypothetical protein